MTTDMTTSRLIILSNMSEQVRHDSEGRADCLSSPQSKVGVMATKWETLAAELRYKIQSGEIRDFLPSESELADMTDASRGTVRAALKALQAEGLITASQGQRSQVKRRKRYQWIMHAWEKAHTTSEDAWAATVRRQGGEPQAHITVLVELPGAEIRDALKIEVDESVVVRRRVRSIDGRPHQLADSYFPLWIGQQHPIFMDPRDVSAPGGLLAASGLPQARFEDRIEARMPTEDEAQRLGVTRTTPLLVHHRTGFMADGRAVRYMVTSMAADSVEVIYEVPA